MSSQLDKLINHKARPCLSVLIPTGQNVSNRLFNRGIVKKNLNHARALLLHNQELDRKTMLKLMKAFDEVASQLDSKKFDEGIGLFVSPAVAELVYFPFAVEEQVILGDSFEVRDLLYLQEHNAPYIVLRLGKKKIRLFRSKGDDVNEVVDRNFPMLFTNDYEYAKPSRGNSFGESVKSFERDKTSLSKVRMLTFFKAADRALDRYLSKGDLIILGGTHEETEHFLNVTAHRQLMAGSVIMNNRQLTHLMINKCRQTIFRFNRAKHQTLLKRLDEDYGNNQVAEGLENVWRAAHEGKGLVLAVEKDFKHKGYLQKNDLSHLHTFPPPGEFQIVSDAVDDVIEKVREKGGQVVFMENNELEKFDHIAMLLRYANSEVAEV